MEELLSAFNLQGCSSKIKLDEFFLEFCQSEEFTAHLDNFTSEMQDTTKLGFNQLMKKSPKKRSHEDIVQHNLLFPHDITNNLYHAPLDLNESILQSEHLLSNSSSDLEWHVTNSRRRANFDTIPVFFRKIIQNPSNPIVTLDRTEYILSHGTCLKHSRIEDDQLATNPSKLLEIETIFKKYNNCIPLNEFIDVTKYLCGFPSFFNKPLIHRINSLYPPDFKLQQQIQPSTYNHSNNVYIFESSFLLYWKYQIEPYDHEERLFNIIKQPFEDYIDKEDFSPFLQELLELHPGLDFLEHHDEFQKKYALTVITRIFYKVNWSRTGRISLREFRRSDLRQVLLQVDEETDINRVTEYFSYEHFYVLYCRFFELDTNKDTKLSREDLQKYNERALSEMIIDRIFEVGARVFSDGVQGEFHDTGGMTFIDFVYFMLSEEDKTSDTALHYWFTCCDFDSAGVLTTEKMQYFFRTQLNRLALVGHDGVKFADALCQMVDLIKPRDPTAITLQDLIDSKPLSGVLFDVLFNFQKFLRFESRDPFQEKMKREDGFRTDWDRFASNEYQRLCTEDDMNTYTGMDIDNNSAAIYSDAKGLSNETSFKMDKLEDETFASEWGALDSKQLGRSFIEDTSSSRESKLMTAAQKTASNSGVTSPSKKSNSQSSSTSSSSNSSTSAFRAGTSFFRRK